MLPLFDFMLSLNDFMLSLNDFMLSLYDIMLSLNDLQQYIGMILLNLVSVRLLIIKYSNLVSVRL